MTMIKLMTASAAAVSLLLVAVGQRDPVPDPGGESYVAKPVEPFDDRWLAAAKPVILIAALLDKPMPPEPAVKMVATETITPPVADPRVVAPKPHEKHVELDTCQRHGMHKIFIHGGKSKSWRCRK